LNNNLNSHVLVRVTNICATHQHKQLCNLKWEKPSSVLEWKAELWTLSIYAKTAKTSLSFDFPYSIQFSSKFSWKMWESQLSLFHNTSHWHLRSFCKGFSKMIFPIFESFFHNSTLRRGVIDTEKRKISTEVCVTFSFWNSLTKHWEGKKPKVVIDFFLYFVFWQWEFVECDKCLK
jgi:hypothetical protein